MISPSIATAADLATPFTSSLTFVTGSGNGAQNCASWTARTDDLVEGDEEFNLVLDLVTPERGLNLGNPTTNIVIMDVDGIMTCLDMLLYDFDSNHSSCLIFN